MTLAGTNRAPARPMLSRCDRASGGDAPGAIVGAGSGLATAGPALRGHGSPCIVHGMRRIACSFVAGGGLCMRLQGACPHCACADKRQAISLRKMLDARLSEALANSDPGGSPYALVIAGWGLALHRWPTGRRSSGRRRDHRRGSVERAVLRPSC
jgi:hypothetical protein